MVECPFLFSLTPAVNFLCSTLPLDIFTVFVFRFQDGVLSTFVGEMCHFDVLTLVVGRFEEDLYAGYEAARGWNWR